MTEFGNADTYIVKYCIRFMAFFPTFNADQAVQMTKTGVLGNNTSATGIGHPVFCFNNYHYIFVLLLLITYIYMFVCFFHMK